ncbi:carbohydrate-binding protein [Vibrio phage vB_VhaP_PG11]|nr:carbohydrate-binding protein [Vibrio phage vB_VhaP_PG11]
MSNLSDFLSGAGSVTPRVEQNEADIAANGSGVATNASNISANASYMNAIPRENWLINGCFTMWQRGTAHSGTLVDGYYADRWRFSGAFTNITRNSHAIGSTNNKSRYVCSISKDAGANAYIDQPIENISGNIESKVFSFSFLVGSQEFLDEIINVQIINYENNTVFAITNADGFVVESLGASWRRVTGTLPAVAISNTTSDHATFRIGLSTNAISGQWISEIKLEEGSNSTPFVREDYSITLNKCERFYQKLVDGTGPVYATKRTDNDLIGIIHMPLRTPMRSSSPTATGTWHAATPDLVEASSRNLRIQWNNASSLQGVTSLVISAEL